MRIYRRFVRAKKGMSTVFGGLFFVILILMGFNLMLWSFIQYDTYNTTLRSMNQNDQLAISENLVPTNPGAQNFSSVGFNIPVNNLGGTTVSISRIYITNISPTGSTNCSNLGASAGPCIIDSPGTQNCAGNGICSFSNGNVGAGEINHLIHVTMPTSVPGQTVNDGSGYKFILSSTRGRSFSFFYPWPVTSVNVGNPGGNFVTNIGPLSIYFDYKSFNFTQGAQTVSQSAFCIPSSSTSVVFWLKIANSATDSSVVLRDTTIMQLQAYAVNGFGQFVTIYIVNQTTVNPGGVPGIIPYNNAQPTVLPPATPNGPASFTLVKFGSTTLDGSTAPSFRIDNNWIMFIGFYYVYRGLTQGETIPFLDMRTTSGYPGSC
jgi:hypothetical protein